ncbi:uncharacterized protein [Diabrotica undecimpunctata]|uniref:uncharacterized protein n=1 Tax=Diabrotica undecimpunctata TaxID=50387 RepID=UPI003B633982
MRQSTGVPPHHHRHIRLDQQPLVPVPIPFETLQSDSVDTLTTTTTASQRTVSVETVEVEEHEVCSDSEFETRETLKLTARTGAAFRRDVSTSTRRPPTTRRAASAARDETTQEIQDEDEATLRELLIRWKILVEERCTQGDIDIVCEAASDRQIRSYKRIF